MTQSQTASGALTHLGPIVVTDAARIRLSEREVLRPPRAAGLTG
jgi:hypothetical protein